MVATIRERGVRRRLHGVDHSPLNRWLRAKGVPGGQLDPVEYRFSVIDLDAYISRNVGGVENWLLCECKSNGAAMTWRQKRQLAEIDRALAFAFQRGYNGSLYRGVHLLQLSGFDVETSRYLWLDGYPVTESDLVRFFRMEAPEDWYDRRPWQVGTKTRDVMDAVGRLRYDVLDILEAAAAGCLDSPSLAVHLDAVIRDLQRVRDRIEQLERTRTHP
jgi:hypothetical protein